MSTVGVWSKFLFGGWGMVTPPPTNNWCLYLPPFQVVFGEILKWPHPLLWIIANPFSMNNCVCVAGSTLHVLLILFKYYEMAQKVGRSSQYSFIIAFVTVKRLFSRHLLCFIGNVSRYLWIDCHYGISPCLVLTNRRRCCSMGNP